jgi:hypothetical protein
MTMVWWYRQEVEREAPNNAFVIIVFGVVGAVLQVITCYT